MHSRAVGADDGAKHYVLRSYLPVAVRSEFLQARNSFTPVVEQHSKAKSPF